MGDDKKHFIESIQCIFQELDLNTSGDISRNELQKHLEDPRIGAYFARLGVDVDQFDKLFNLLDTDASGSIDLDEFTFGCLRLKGEAKCLDIEDLRHKIFTIIPTVHERIDNLGNELISHVHEQLASLTWNHSNADATVTESVKAVNSRLDHIDAMMVPVVQEVGMISSTLASAAKRKRLKHVDGSIPAIT